jgi:hypothetical protein
VSPRSDDSGVTPRRRLDARTADALLAGRVVDGEAALTGLIAELRVLPDAPVPNAALSAMLASGLIPDVVPLPERRAPRVRSTWALPLQIALGTSACVALVLGAAATGELPDPAQTAVADVVEAVTPLHLPRPATHPPVPAVVPSPTQSAQPNDDQPGDGQTNDGQTNDQPGDGPRSQPPRPSASPDDHRGSGGSSTGDGGDHQDGGQPSASPSSGRSDHNGGGTSGGAGTSGSSGSGGSGSTGPDGSDDNGKDLSGGHDGSGGSSGSSTGGGSSDDSHLSGSSSDQ